MALLAEYALTPDVFDATSYNSEEVCGLHLQTLKEVLLNEGLVRDLPLHFAVGLEPERQFLGARQVAAEIDEVALRVEALCVELIEPAAEPAYMKDDAGIELGLRFFLLERRAIGERDRVVGDRCREAIAAKRQILIEMLIVNAGA